MGPERLDDQDYPAITIGQAAELLGVQPAFLRSLDAADLLHPYRSDGGQRRYSRRQLDFAARVRALSDQGHTIAGAASVLGLRDDLAAAQRDLSAARHDLQTARRDLENVAGQRDHAVAERDRAREELAHARDARGAHPPHPGAPGSSGSSGR